MVFAKVTRDSNVAGRALRGVLDRRKDQEEFKRRISQTLAFHHSQSDVAALRQRHRQLTCSDEMFSEANSLVPTNQMVDVLFRGKGGVGPWASALRFLQQQVADPGLDLTTDHAARVISLWSRNATERPPAALLLQWWMLLSLERPEGFDDSSNGPSLAMRLLPAVTEILAEGRYTRQALRVLATEAAIGKPSGVRCVAEALDGVVAASIDAQTSAACEQHAIESCLSSLNSLPTSGGLPWSLLEASQVLDRKQNDFHSGVPSFTVVYSEASGTLSKSALDGSRCSFNGIASAIVASRPSLEDGLRMCNSFAGATTPNAACVLEELRLRWLSRIDADSALRGFDLIPEERRTPFMMATCLRILVAEGAYDAAVTYARMMCDAWGHFTIPCTVLNRLVKMREGSSHSDSFWELIDRAGGRVSEISALSAIGNQVGLQPGAIRVVPVDEVLVNLQEMAILGKVTGARLIMDRLPSIPPSRVGDAEDDIILGILSSAGDDWQLALESLVAADV